VDRFVPQGSLIKTG